MVTNSSRCARIISKIVRDLYSIKPISATRRWALTLSLSKELSAWRAELARFLDADLFSTSLIIPIFQRQRNVLNLTYWHAVILVHRPLVLSNFARGSQKNGDGLTANISEGEDGPTEQSLQQCLMAAMNTVETIDEITQTGQMFRAFWVSRFPDD